MATTIEEKVAEVCLNSGVTQPGAIGEINDLVKMGVIKPPEGEAKLKRKHIAKWLDAVRERRPELFTSEPITNKKSENPFLPGPGFSMLRQGQIFKANPKLANALCLKATGHPLGSPKAYAKAK